MKVTEVTRNWDFEITFHRIRASHAASMQSTAAFCKECWGLFRKTYVYGLCHTFYAPSISVVSSPSGHFLECLPLPCLLSTYTVRYKKHIHIYIYTYCACDMNVQPYCRYKLPAPSPRDPSFSLVFEFFCASTLLTTLTYFRFQPLELESRLPHSLVFQANTALPEQSASSSARHDISLSLTLIRSYRYIYVVIYTPYTISLCLTAYIICVQYYCKV